MIKKTLHAFMLMLMLMLMLMPFFTVAFSWWGNKNYYRVEFVDGRFVEPIITQSLFDNWDEYPIWGFPTKTVTRFFFDFNKLYDINMQAIQEAGVEDLVINAQKIGRMSNGHIDFKEVEKVKYIKGDEKNYFQ